jgi:ABC-type branched-subunit amino acid transport system permease subunit
VIYCRASSDPAGALAASYPLVNGMVVYVGLGTLWVTVIGSMLLYGLYEGLRFVGVVYNLVAVGFVIMVFVIFFPRGLAGFGRSA